MGKERRPVACDANVLSAKHPMLIFAVRVRSHTYGVSILIQ